MEKVQRNSIDKKQNGLKYLKNGKLSTLPCTTALNEFKFTLENIGKFINMVFRRPGDCVNINSAHHHNERNES